MTFEVAGCAFGVPIRVILTAGVVCLSSVTSLLAQWPRMLPPGVPRTADGRVDMNAPTPRTADGKPDLSGV